MEPITYALAGCCPAPFPYGKIKVFDLDTGQEVLDVKEVNTVEGWLESLKRGGDGRYYVDPENHEQAATQRIEGRYEIRVTS